jgi:hypothetical protein
MLGFHKRTRSLIPVKDLAKYDKVSSHVEEEMDLSEDELDIDLNSEPQAKARQMQLALVYAIFLAEAYV